MKHVIISLIILGTVTIGIAKFSHSTEASAAPMQTAQLEVHVGTVHHHHHHRRHRRVVVVPPPVVIHPEEHHDDHHDNGHHEDDDHHDRH